MTPQLILVAGPYRSGTNEHAGSERIGDAAFNEMVSPAHGQGKPVYFSLNEIPPC